MKFWWLLFLAMKFTFLLLNLAQIHIFIPKCAGGRDLGNIPKKDQFFYCFPNSGLQQKLPKIFAVSLIQLQPCLELTCCKIKEWNLSVKHNPNDLVLNIQLPLAPIIMQSLLLFWHLKAMKYKIDTSAPDCYLFSS